MATIDSRRFNGVTHKTIFVLFDRPDNEYLALCRWACDHTPIDAVFLVPPQETEFRYYARRAIVVNFKGVPQLAGELIDLDTYEVRPARAELERLIDWVAPIADELGVSSYLAVPAANATERQLARYAEGATLEQIYAEQVRPKERVGG